MRLVLTRRRSGLYLLTAYQPVMVSVGVTDVVDAYARPGDPIAYYPVCDWFRENVLGVPELEILESHRCELLGSPRGSRYFVLRRSDKWRNSNSSETTE